MAKALDTATTSRSPRVARRQARAPTDALDAAPTAAPTAWRGDGRRARARARTRAPGRGAAADCGTRLSRRCLRGAARRANARRSAFCARPLLPFGRGCGIRGTTQGFAAAHGAAPRAWRLNSQHAPRSATAFLASCCTSYAIDAALLLCATPLASIFRAQPVQGPPAALAPARGAPAPRARAPRVRPTRMRRARMPACLPWARPPLETRRRPLLASLPMCARRLGPPRPPPRISCNPPPPCSLPQARASSHPRRARPVGAPWPHRAALTADRPAGPRLQARRPACAQLANARRVDGT
jgi:hypothetical protein